MPLEDNTPSYSPTATLDRQPSVETYEYNIPESDEVRAYRERQEANLTARSIEEQTTPQEVRDGMIDLFDDTSELGYLDNGNNQPAEHSRVTSIELTHREEPSDEEKMHAIIERMSPLEQTKMIIDTGRYFVPNVRLNTVEMSRSPR